MPDIAAEGFWLTARVALSRYNVEESGVTMVGVRVGLNSHWVNRTRKSDCISSLRIPNAKRGKLRR
jgi:hypothetical protein